jgi:hypothetical protein
MTFRQKAKASRTKESISTKAMAFQEKATAFSNNLFNKIVKKRTSIGRTTNDQHAEEPK